MVAISTEGPLPPITHGTRVRSQRYLNETPEARQRRLTASKAYAAANKKKIVEYKAKWAAENAPAYNREYYQRNKEKIKQRSSNWRCSNVERKRNNNKRWAKANPDKALLSSRQYKRRRRVDPSVRLLKSVSEHIRLSLKGSKDGASWEALLGYSRQQLVTHIERQFVDGMSWANYGQWHIDHILPASGFRFDGPNHPEFKACWALTNLRPLWALDNISKKDRRLHLL